mmetsp:Transcript_10221/g.33691  ORF Transcript_10221/g.33691 Transcript_10221/m.33691 type:complete len:247 (+) Transcript_10221:660-1400(+)
MQQGAEPLVDALEVERKHRVRAGRRRIHVGAPDRPLLGCLGHEQVDLLHRVHLELAHVCHDGPPLVIVLNGQRRLRPAFAGEQVAQLLIVHLEKGGAERPLPAVLAHEFRLAQNLAERARDQPPRLRVTATLHRVRLAGPSLAVGEDADLVAVERRLDQAIHLLEKLVLRGVGLKDLVEGEVVRLGVVRQAQLVLGRRQCDGVALGWRAHAAEDADVSFELLHRVVQRAARRLGLEQLGLQRLDED